MPRQPASLVSDRLLSLVASGGERGSTGDLVDRLEGGWVPVEPGSIEIPGRAGDEAGDVRVTPAQAGRAERRRAQAPGRHRAPLGRPGPRVVTLPVSLRGARIDVSWVGIMALVLVLAVAALLFAVRVARAESGVAPRPLAGSTPLGVLRGATPSAFVSAATPRGGASGVSSTGTAGASGVAASGSVAPATIVVHVVGQVVHPGVVSLPGGSRIIDAVTHAGGPLPGADLARLNLAQFLADGEQVYVPRPGEDPPAPIGGAGGPGGGSGSGVSSGPGASTGRSGGSSAAAVDLNSADVAGLDTLPGVGPVLAQRILDWRGKHGRFSAVDELGEVTGIGDKLLEQLRPLVRV